MSPIPPPCKREAPEHGIMQGGSREVRGKETGKRSLAVDTQKLGSPVNEYVYFHCTQSAVILQIKDPNSCDVVRVMGVGSCNGHE